MKMAIGKAEAAEDFRRAGWRAVGIDGVEFVIDFSEFLGIAASSCALKESRRVSAAKIVSKRLTGVAGCS